MPIYVYKCDHCGRVVELQRKIAEMDEPLACDAKTCGQNPLRLTIDFMRRVPTAPAKTPDKWH